MGLALLSFNAWNVTKNVNIILGYEEYIDEERKAIQSSSDLMKLFGKGTWFLWREKFIRFKIKYTSPKTIIIILFYIYYLLFKKYYYN